MLTLVIQDKNGGTKTHHLPKDEAAIGRMHSGNDIVLSAPNVSKHHAKLYKKDGRLVVEDLKSTCGTYVNGIKVSGVHSLGPTDKVYIGDFIIEMEDAEEEAQALDEEDLEPESGPAGAPLAPPPARALPGPQSVAPTSAMPIIDIRSGPNQAVAPAAVPVPSPVGRLASGPLPVAPLAAPQPARQSAQQEALYTALTSLTVAVEALYRMVLDERQKPPMSIRAAAAIEETRNALQRYQREK